MRTKVTRARENQFKKAASHLGTADLLLQVAKHLRDRHAGYAPAILDALAIESIAQSWMTAEERAEWRENGTSVAHSVHSKTDEPRGVAGF